MAKNKIATYIVVLMLLLSIGSVFIKVPMVKATTQPNVFGVYCTATANLLGNPSAFWANFDGKGLNTIVLEAATFLSITDSNSGPDGTLFFNEPLATLQSFVATINTHNPNINVYLCAYDDDVYFPNITSITVQTTMAAGVVVALSGLSGTSTHFNGFCLDLELYDGFLGNLTGLISFYNLFATTCAAMGGKSMVYLGPHNNAVLEAADNQLFESLTVTYANVHWNIFDSYWSPIFYNEIRVNCSVGWTFEMRAASSNSDGETIQNDFTSLSGVFTSGFPSNYNGLIFWAYPYISLTNPSEWATIAAQLPNFESTPTPTPSPTPTSTPTPTPTPQGTATPTPPIEVSNTSGIPTVTATDFGLFLAALIVLDIIALLWIPVLGAFVGILGVGGSLFFWNMGVLEINKYTVGNQVYYSVMPVGWLILIPLMISFASFAIVFLQKRGK